MCLCDGRLLNSIIINFLLFITAGNVSVVWESFLVQDCVIEHRFVSGEKHREHKVDGRRQGELQSKQYGSSIRSDRVIMVEIQGNGILTPRRYAISNKRVLTPTRILVFMLLISPGIVGGTDTIIAAAARQFLKLHKGRDA
jgi:hypothetical protein